MATTLKWLGHSTWLIESGHHRILIDPFLDQNPAASCQAADVEADYILVSHGHFDHLADVAEIANRCHSSVVANYEIASWFAEKHGVKHTLGMNLGGWVRLPFGRVKMTIAWHSSQLPDGSYGGNPGGYLIELLDLKVYYAGDTALFSDMQLIGAEKIDVAILPIGDLFTMGPADSVAATNLISPRFVLPTHYNTWQSIAQDTDVWCQLIRQSTSSEPIVLKPGGRHRFE